KAPLCARAGGLAYSHGHWGNTLHYVYVNVNCGQPHRQPRALGPSRLARCDTPGAFKEPWPWWRVSRGATLPRSSPHARSTMSASKLLATAWRHLAACALLALSIHALAALPP